MIIFSLQELADDLRTTNDILRDFLETLDTYEPDEEYTQERVSQLSSIWHACGADKQYKVVEEHEQEHEQEPNKISWKTHMQSKLWESVRSEAISIAHNRCRICGTTQGRKTVHHSYYQTMGMKDERNAVIALCEPCHKIADQLRKKAVKFQ